jgi:putative FmdB family regulatory protein
MPTYEYRCGACGHEFEEFQSITANPLKKCPSCAKLKLQRLIGTGGGIIFRGSGFYETDYRSESYKKAAEAETKPAGSETKAGDGGKKSEGGTSGGEKATGEKPPGKSGETSGGKSGGTSDGGSGKSDSKGKGAKVA